MTMGEVPVAFVVVREDATVNTEASDSTMT
jgi:hypothetical protein